MAKTFTCFSWFWGLMVVSQNVSKWCLDDPFDKLQMVMISLQSPRTKIICHLKNCKKKKTQRANLFSLKKIEDHICWLFFFGGRGGGCVVNFIMCLAANRSCSASGFFGIPLSSKKYKLGPFRWQNPDPGSFPEFFLKEDCINSEIRGVLGVHESIFFVFKELKLIGEIVQFEGWSVQNVLF